ncbi:MAG: hypothetical protein HKN09_11455, partial [Saprospiraceae bacterium]|nr:hypothetical protein [Saprospiraceae bacterium]
EALADTGHAPRLGMKCRLVASDKYYIIDGNQEFKMANLLLRLREGRAEEVLLEFSEIGMALMKKYLAMDVEEKSIILSTEIKELVKGQDLTFNSIRLRTQE